MKKLLAMCGLAALASVAAYGAPSCANISSAGLTNGTLLTDASDTCDLNGIIFSNFAVYAGTGFTGNAFSMTVTIVGNSLQFTTSNLAINGEDIEIYFQAVPGITGIVLQTGPNDATTETICGVAFNQAVGSESCVSPLNQSSLSSFNQSISQSVVGASAIDYFVKDDSGGSQVSQSFTPEPMTFSLMGVGLLGLGLLGRKIRK